MITLTKNEMLQKYGDVELKFNYYYKYNFGFVANLGDNKTVNVNVGGSAEQIYTLDVDADEVYILSNLTIHSLELYENGIQIEEYFDEY